jgi:hypothetical protein
LQRHDQRYTAALEGHFMRRPIPFLLAAVVSLVTVSHANLARADVYKSVDAQGQVHYSDQWSPGAELMKGMQTVPGPAAAAPTKPADNTPPPPRVDEKTTQAVQADVAAAQAEQCKQAKDAYDKAIHARHLYRDGKDGAREYLSDTDADQQRVQMRQAMDTACGSGDSK